MGGENSGAEIIVANDQISVVWVDIFFSSSSSATLSHLVLPITHTLSGSGRGGSCLFWAEAVW
jgi:hypothetical protein